MNKKFISFIVKKYLKFDKTQPFISVSFILAFLGIMTGVGVLIIAMSIMNGMDKEFEKKLTIYIHTLNDKVIKVGDDIHIPKSFHRFAGLIEKLFYEKRIESEGNTLLEMTDMSFPELVETINPKNVVGLSSMGKSSSYAQVGKSLNENSCIVIGGFQKGHFLDSTKNKIDNLVSIDSHSLESHVVTARILYEYEKTIFM